MHSFREDSLLLLTEHMFVPATNILRGTLSESERRRPHSKSDAATATDPPAASLPATSVDFRYFNVVGLVMTSPAKLRGCEASEPTAIPKGAEPMGPIEFVRGDCTIGEPFGKRRCKGEPNSCGHAPRCDDGGNGGKPPTTSSQDASCLEREERQHALKPMSIATADHAALVA